MMLKERLWVEGEVIRMANNELFLNALGVYGIGYNLERLEWAIATTEKAPELAPFFERLRWYEQVHSFEDIGREAKHYHDMLSGYKEQEVSGETKNDLRAARTRWDTLARERLQGLYLVTPMSKIDPKHLMTGISGFLGQEYLSVLEKIEVIDLNEACFCILVGSATAAEHIALRAAESLLRRWYEYKTGKKLIRRTWGTVLKRLAKEYPENKRPKEITLLGYLKQRRDEVAHPDRVSSPIEAEATLMNVCSLIEGIAPVLTKVALSQVSAATPPTPELEAPPLQELSVEGGEGADNGEPAVEA